MRRDHRRALVLFEQDMKARNLVPKHTKFVLGIVGDFLAKTPKQLRKIRRKDVEAYLAALFDEGRSSDFHCRAYVALSSFFGVLVRDELLPEDPTEQIFVKKPPRAPQLLLSEEAVRRLLAAASVEPANRARRTPALSRAIALRDRACLELLYSLGLRLSEAARIHVTDLRLKEREVFITRSKRGRSGAMPLPPASVPHLERYVRYGRPVLVSKRDHKGRLLLTRLGNPIWQTVVAWLVNQAARRAGLPRAHPHALRRAIGTHLVQAGVSVLAVQYWLGHRALESAARYIEVSRDELRRTVELLELAPE